MSSSDVSAGRRCRRRVPCTLVVSAICRPGVQGFTLPPTLAPDALSKLRPCAPTTPSLLSSSRGQTWYTPIAQGHHTRLSTPSSLRQSNDATTGSAAQDSVEEQPSLFSAPRGEIDMIFQASQAILRATAAGKSRQSVRIALPPRFATEFVEWPGGIQQKYEVAEPLVRQLMRKLDDPSAGMVSRIKVQVLEPADCMAVMFAEAPDKKDDKLAIVFPTTEGFMDGKTQGLVAGMKDRLVVLVNTQWKSTGDFGFFGRKKAEKVLGEYEEVYSLSKWVCRGETVAVLRCYPGPWQLFKQVGKDAGTATKYEDLGSFRRGDQPTFREVERILSGEQLDSWVATGQSSGKSLGSSPQS